MKFLVIVQDLRISGTSEGIVSRSFLSKLRTAYPQAVIDVVYLKHHNNEDKLELLPVDKIDTHAISLKIPFLFKLVNSVYWRIFNVSLNRLYLLKKYAKVLARVNHEKYDQVFLRSSGLEYETILASKDLPILSKVIINLHDPYPTFWDTGSIKKLTKLELNRLQEMWEVVTQAKACLTPSGLLSKDMEHLYGSNKKFYTLPHQYNKDVFDFSDCNLVRKKQKPVTISYHGAIQLTRNIDILLDAYLVLINENQKIKEETEFVLRLRGAHTERLKEKYKNTQNIIFLETLDFSNSSFEQETETDIVIILENCSIQSNILVGKAPFLASLQKSVLSLSPKSSEIRNIIKDSQFIANCNDIKEIQGKLENLISKEFLKKEPKYPFGDYFSDANFKILLDEVLSANK